MLNHAEWLNEPRFNDPLQRMDPFVIEEWNTYFLGWCLDRTKREIWTEVRRAKVLGGPMFTMEDLYHDSHFRDRGLWTKVEHPDMGEVEMVGRPFLMGKGGWELRRRAPRLGEHTAEVLTEAGVAQGTIDAITNQEAVR